MQALSLCLSLPYPLLSLLFLQQLLSLSLFISLSLSLSLFYLFSLFLPPSPRPRWGVIYLGKASSLLARPTPFLSDEDLAWLSNALLSNTARTKSAARGRGRGTRSSVSRRHACLKSGKKQARPTGNRLLDRGTQGYK